jgi:hypothetical protein
MNDVVLLRFSHTSGQFSFNTIFDTSRGTLRLTQCAMNLLSGGTKREHPSQQEHPAGKLHC